MSLQICALFDYQDLPISVYYHFMKTSGTSRHTDQTYTHALDSVHFGILQKACFAWTSLNISFFSIKKFFHSSVILNWGQLLNYIQFVTTSNILGFTSPTNRCWCQAPWKLLLDSFPVAGAVPPVPVVDAKSSKNTYQGATLRYVGQKLTKSRTYVENLYLVCTNALTRSNTLSMAANWTVEHLLLIIFYSQTIHCWVQ